MVHKRRGLLSKALVFASVVPMLATACGGPDAQVPAANQQATQAPTQGAAQETPAGSSNTQTWKQPVDLFSPGGTRQTSEYEAIPVSEVSKQWNICAAFPHLKDSYWLAVNYGIVSEVKRVGAKMQLFEAGGYTELDKQLNQLDDCVAQGADGIILGAISSDGVVAKVEEIVDRGIPVVGLAIPVNSPKVPMAIADWADMGAAAGEFLKGKLTDGQKVKVAFFPGPQGAGWTDATLAGFQKVVEGTGIEVVDVKWGDTGKEEQLSLVEDVLQAHPDLDYIVGNAVASIVAGQAVAEANRQDQVQIIATYITPDLYDPISAGQVAGAPSDLTAFTGQLGVDMLVRLLEGQKLPANQIGPKINVVSKDTLSSFVWETTFAPRDFKPTFTVD